MQSATCPACNAELQRASSHWEMLACLSCGGVWTDAHASRRIMTTVDRELVTIAREVAMQAADPEHDLAVASEGSRKCPVCAKAMMSVRVGHVTLDVCEPHGTWFDRDELGRLARNLEHERISHTPSPPEEPVVPSKNAAMLLALIGRAS